MIFMLSVNRAAFHRRLHVLNEWQDAYPWGRGNLFTLVTLRVVGTASFAESGHDIDKVKKLTGQDTAGILNARWPVCNER